jgi:hypothetical protein
MGHFREVELETSSREIQLATGVVCKQSEAELAPKPTTLRLRIASKLFV